MLLYGKKIAGENYQVWKIQYGGQGESFVKIFDGTLKNKSFTIASLISIVQGYSKRLSGF